MTGKTGEGADVNQLPLKAQPWWMLYNKFGLPTVLVIIGVLILIGKIDSPLITMADTQVKTEQSLRQMTEKVSEHESSQSNILNQLIRLTLAGCVNDNLARNDSLGAQICTAGLGPKPEQDRLINQALIQHQQKVVGSR